MDNYKDTILSQYATSPVITALVESFNEWIRLDADLDNFYDYVFNVETAQGFGLDILGRIVNIGRVLQVPATLLYFGFNESSNGQPFGQKPFYNGPAATQAYALGDEAYRKLILLKALSNIANCTAPSLNTLLEFFFAGEGPCYVVDTGAMQIRFVFEFTLQPYEMAILTTSGAMPRPAGVLAQVLTVDPATTFGFQEAGGQPFGSGVFFNQSEISNVV